MGVVLREGHYYLISVTCIYCLWNQSLLPLPSSSLYCFCVPIVHCLTYHDVHYLLCAIYMLLGCEP